MLTVAAAETTIVCAHTRRDAARTRLGNDGVADALGQGVVSRNGQTFCASALNGQQHCMVVAGAAVFQIADAVVVLAFSRIDERQNLALSNVSRVGAGRVHRVVQLILRTPNVNGAASDVVARKRPVLSKLTLQTQ